MPGGLRPGTGCKESKIGLKVSSLCIEALLLSKLHGVFWLVAICSPHILSAVEHPFFWPMATRFGSLLLFFVAELLTDCLGCAAWNCGCRVWSHKQKERTSKTGLLEALRSSQCS